MADLHVDCWPPVPMETDRLILRQTQASDRAGFIDLLVLPEARVYLGGPVGPRDVLERDAPEVPGSRPGVFAIEHAGAFVGMVHLSRRDPDAPGHIRDEGFELEVSYQVLPAWWGQGFAFEAVTAVLAWAAATLADTDVILCTQVANARSRRLAARLGFTEAARFEAYGAAQWLGRRAL